VLSIHFKVGVEIFKVGGYSIFKVGGYSIFNAPNDSRSTKIPR
jgi:hypothetical protein